MNPYQIEHLFTYRLQLAPPQIIGPVPGDVRLDFPIVGGEITGPCLQGSVKPGGQTSARCGPMVSSSLTFGVRWRAMMGR